MTTVREEADIAGATEFCNYVQVENPALEVLAFPQHHGASGLVDHAQQELQ